ncbi:MAG: lysophospholipase [Actinobacteria bacterium]|nr:lysophospholipase [Actinomycetota bacterium]
MRRPLFTAVLAVCAVLAVGAVPNDAPTEHTVERVEVHSDAAQDPATIVISVFRPAGASARAPVPVILHGHGWGGSRTTDVESFRTLLDAGYGVVSIDQRGFGESGGRAGAMDPDNEGWDLIAVMDHVASLDWVATEDGGPGRPADPGERGRRPDVSDQRRAGSDGDASNPFERDPVVGAIGGSYGGGYQFLLALMETREFGTTRLDALTPEITWHNLNVSLAPSDVLRTAWTTLLTAVAVNRVEPYILEAYTYSMATGQIADGTVPGVYDIKSEFFTHGPSGFVADGVLLDVPVLMRQGMSDNLFNYNDAWHNFTRTLTEQARDRSTLIGYNGGHVLPNVLPAAEATGGDVCSGDGGFSARRLEFFDNLLKGRGDTPRVVGGGEPLHFTTVDGDACISLSEAALPEAHRLVDPTGVLGSSTGTLTMAGAPIHLEIEGTEGLTLAGVPTLDATLYAAGADTRVFLALSRGTSPSDATVLQNNVLPIRSLLPAVGTPLEGHELPGVAVEMAEDEKLFLTISPLSDMFIAHGSRTPGAIALTDVTIDLPVVP